MATAVGIGGKTELKIRDSAKLRRGFLVTEYMHSSGFESLIQHKWSLKKRYWTAGHWLYWQLAKHILFFFLDRQKLLLDMSRFFFPFVYCGFELGLQLVTPLQYRQSTDSRLFVMAVFLCWPTPKRNKEITGKVYEYPQGGSSSIIHFMLTCMHKQKQKMTAHVC